MLFGYARQYTNIYHSSEKLKVIYIKRFLSYAIITINLRLTCVASVSNQVIVQKFSSHLSR